MSARNTDDKKGFCLFFDWVEDLDYLDGADAWIVVKALCDYYKNKINPIDNVPKELKPMVSMMFHQIQRQEDIKVKRQEAGRSGGFATAKNSKGVAMLQQKSPTETDTITDTETNTNNKGSDSAPPVQIFGEFHHVKLTEEQHSKLIDTYGESMTADYIRRLDEYIEQKGAKYKNHYLAVRNWINKDNERSVNNEHNGNNGSGTTTPPVRYATTF